MFLVLTTALLCCVAIAAEDSKPVEGQPAPAISMQTLDGKTVTLADAKGSVVVVDFWATWCIPCREVLAHLQKLQDDKELVDKGLKIWAVDAISKVETKEKVKNFVEEKKFTFTIALDQDSKGREAYHVQEWPTTAVIGRDGKLFKLFEGYKDEQDTRALEAAIREALQAPAQ